MSTEVIPFQEMQSMAKAIAESGLFGLKNETQVLALMAVAQAEGRHPAIVARDYDLINGRPAKKAEAMLRDFLASGGKVEWHALSDEIADATFSHPSGGEARIAWDMKRVKQAQISNAAMYSKYPRQMLRSRCVSEGVRTVWPGATSGAYVPEEVEGYAKGPVHSPKADDLKPMDPEQREQYLANIRADLDVDQKAIEKPRAAELCLKILDLWDELTADEQIQVHEGLNTKQKKKLKHISALDRAMLKAESKVIEGATAEAPSTP